MPAKTTGITAEQVRDLLSYDADSGIFRWMKSRGRLAKAGSIAGSIEGKGYRQIKIQGESWMAHRLAWLVSFGELPCNMIDHVNGVKDDNRLVNLRVATNSENCQNQKQAKANNSTSGLLGVSWHTRDGKWKSQICVDGKDKFLGYFKSKEEAYKVYLEAKKNMHPFSSPDYRGAK